MNTVITLYDFPDEWYQDTYICCECETKFMMNHHTVPRFCPCCGVKFDALRIKYPTTQGGHMETRFISDEEEEE